jgi:hypothetical protein
MRVRSSRSSFSACSLLLVLAAASGCKDEGVFSDSAPPIGDGGTRCTEGQVQCSGNILQTCRGGVFAQTAACKDPQVCSTTLKRCAACEPTQNACKGNDLYSCAADGNLGAKIKTCTSLCVSGSCDDPCSKAEQSRSYVGCSYWPTVTANSQLALDFTYAVVVVNAHSASASVTVASISNPSVATATVAPNSLATIKLPWVAGLKQSLGSETSVLEKNGAYHLTSTLPVTVYQFNALEYVINHDCTQGQDREPGDGKCYSYTNDASLLLPEHALGLEHMVIARPTLALRQVNPIFPGPFLFSPGFFAVVGTQPGDTKVTVTFTANSQAGTGGLAAHTKGESAEFVVPQWGVLEILSEMPKSCTPTKTEGGYDYCDLSGSTDLTGTRIQSDKLVAVYSGHNCAFVPYDKWACDHLEQQIFPTKSWGKRYIATQTASGADPSVYRIVSAKKDNEITFAPASVHAPVTLDEGQMVELVTKEDFDVKGTGAFALVQFMVGQNYSSATPGEGAPGDPSMALVVPVEQYRTSYRFLAPETYQQNYVNVVASQSATVRLDGSEIAATEFQTVGATSYKVARLKIAGGSHSIESTTTFGILVYGVGAYTSYMYPGGLDLRLLD